jgi:hypothetical protein
MSPYYSFKDLIENGEHLEHLHSYYLTNAKKSNQESSTASEQKMTMDLHKDVGILIAMTSGYYNDENIKEQDNENESQFNGLYVQLSNGIISKAKARNDALIIMVGNGGEKWLQPILGESLINIRIVLSCFVIYATAFRLAFFVPLFVDTSFVFKLTY